MARDQSYPPPSSGQGRSGNSSGAPSSADDIAEQLAREFGIDPAQITAGSGGNPYAIFGIGNDIVNQPVGEGLSLTPSSRRRTPPVGARGTERFSTQAGGGLITASVGKVLQDFYKMSPSVLRKTQALLFAGGFYGDADVTEIPWGQHDEASFAAWAQLIERTARLNAAGQDVTYHGVLSEAANAAGIDRDALGAALESGDPEAIEDVLSTGTEEGRLIDIILSDPNSLRANMDAAASAVLGRKSTAAEQRMFISMIHNVQRQGQMQRQLAEPGEITTDIDPAGFLGMDDTMLRPGDVVTEYAPPDEGATAEALARQQNPAEAGAHDIALQFANFLDLLQSPVNVPRLTI